MSDEALLVDLGVGEGDALLLGVGAESTDTFTKSDCPTESDGGSHVGSESLGFGDGISVQNLADTKGILLACSMVISKQLHP